MAKQKQEHILGTELQSALTSVAAPRATKVAETRGRPDKDKVAATFYIPRPTHKRLKEMALARSTSLQHSWRRPSISGYSAPESRRSIRSREGLKRGAGKRRSRR
jgi:hypothetical protein